MRIPVGRIPKYTSASSPTGLQRSMLKIQTKLGYGVEFFGIQKIGKKWWAWYYDGDDITLENAKDRIATNSKRD